MSSTKSRINSYEDAQVILETARNKDRGKPIANNTRVVCNGTIPFKDGDRDILAIRLHSTDVVTYYPNGKIMIDSGGWRTVTTKDRINQFSPFHIWSDKQVWYASIPVGYLQTEEFDCRVCGGESFSNEYDSDCQYCRGTGSVYNTSEIIKYKDGMYINLKEKK